MNLPDEKELKFYERHKVAPPSHESHNIADTFENPLSEQLLKGNCRNWRLEGNTLLCDTDFGPLSQVIPSDYICIGEKDGLPLLKKVV